MTDWHDPVANPQSNKYSFGRVEKPRSSYFGNVRSGGARFHSGMDLFVIPEITEVYACLDCKYLSASSHVVVLEVINTKELIRQFNYVNYKIGTKLLTNQSSSEKEYLAGTALPGYKGKEAEFELKDTDKIRLYYIHLYEIYPKHEVINETGIVKAGTVLGYAGVEGNANGTKAPHLHFGIKNITKDPKEKYYLNPALFINLEDIDDEKQDKANKPWPSKANK